MECFDGDRICEKCNRREAWKSCRDCVPSRDYFDECFQEVHRTMRPHTVIDIMRVPRPYPEVPKCKHHVGQPRTMVCNNCDASLCVECLHDERVACPSGQHDTKLATKAAKPKRKEIAQALGTAVSQKTQVDDYIADLDQMEKELSKQDDQAESDMTAYHRSLQKKWKDHYKLVRETLAEHREHARIHQDTIQQRSSEAQMLLSRSSDVEVYEQAPSLVAQLTATCDFTRPTLDLATFASTTPGKEVAPGTAQEGMDGLVKAVGSLTITSPLRPSDAEPAGSISSDAGPTTAISSAASPTLTASTEPVIVYIEGQCMKVNDELYFPAARCTVDTSVGPVVVEAFGSQGLYSTGGPDGERVKVSKDGVEHHGVCTGMDDGRVVYSTTCKKSRHTITMYFPMNGKLVQISEVSVQGSRVLTRIRAGPKTGRLVVVDDLFPRLTIHSPDCTLLRCIGSPLSGHTALKTIVGAEWSLCEVYMYVSDWGKGLKDERVFKLSLTDSAQLMWQTPLVGEEPLNIRAIGQCLYITHFGKMGSTVTVLSAENGDVLKVINCPGSVREVTATGHKVLELAYYSQ